MLTNKKGSLIGAVLAVSIGILVIHVNFVIFQGIYDAILRDMTDYRFGDIFISIEHFLNEMLRRRGWGVGGPGEGTPPPPPEVGRLAYL